VLRKGTFIAMVFPVLLMSTGLANAGSEILACEGRYYPPGYDRSTNTVITVSNLNDDATLKVDRIVAYEFPGGNVICDTDLGQITTPDNLLDPMGPNDGRWFAMLPANCPGLYTIENYTHNFNVKIYWSSEGGYKNPLQGKAAMRQLSPEGERAGVSVYECNSVK
jgi:hypothetical protein